MLERYLISAALFACWEAFLGALGFMLDGIIAGRGLSCMYRSSSTCSSRHLGSLCLFVCVCVYLCMCMDGILFGRGGLFAIQSKSETCFVLGTDERKTTALDDSAVGTIASPIYHYVLNKTRKNHREENIQNSPSNFVSPFHLDLCVWYLLCEVSSYLLTYPDTS